MDARPERRGRGRCAALPGRPGHLHAELPLAALLPRAPGRRLQPAMRPFARQHRWGLLAVGMVASAGVGTVLGRAYERRVAEEPKRGRWLASVVDVYQ